MEYTICAETIDELFLASERVDALMDINGSGRNAIYYQIIGQQQPAPIDTGFITDESLRELAQGFLVSPFLSAGGEGAKES